MDYEEKLARLTEEDFFAFFDFCKTEPRWVNSAGHKVIQILGRCHNGGSHSVIFDPITLKCTCFSECGCGMLLHNWARRVLKSENPQEGKDFIEDWIDGNLKDISERLPVNSNNFVYEERPFDPDVQIKVQPTIGQEYIDEMWQEFDTSEECLTQLQWHTVDGIEPEMLALYDVCGWIPSQQMAEKFGSRSRIILPHHNQMGGICGVYERSFWILRSEAKKQFPDITWKDLMKFPRAKYLPLVRWGKALELEEIDGKTSWSFQNSMNLYGLHLAQESIKQTGRAIIFEGGKSVMLSRQFGIPYTVATHTFGAHTNHIAMLIKAGAKRIYLGFDKQYESINETDPQWHLYNHRTLDFAKKIGKYVDVYRLTDYNNLIRYKDAPVDRGKGKYLELLNSAEPLVINGEVQTTTLEKKKEAVQRMLSREKSPDYEFGNHGNILEMI